jgi:hypothetical protein
MVMRGTIKLRWIDGSAGLPTRLVGNIITDEPGQETGVPLPPKKNLESAGRMVN